MRLTYSLCVALTTLLTLLPIPAGLLLWGRLPEQVATSFGFSGEVTGYSTRAFAVWGMPLLLAAMQLFLAFMLRFNPRRRNVPEKLSRFLLLIVPVTGGLCSTLIFTNAMGVTTDIARILTAFSGFLFLIIGNYLPKVRLNYAVGFRLPWTLSSEENWYRTHRLGGVCMSAGGLLLLLSSLVSIPSVWRAALLFPVLIVILAVPTVYSFVLYRRG